MDKHRFFIVVLAIVLCTTAVYAQGSKEDAKTAEAQKTLTVYAYDSFTGDWGPGPTIIPQFEEQTGIKVNLVSAGDAVEMLQRAMLEKDRPNADVIVGISDDMAAKALASGLFDPYDSPMLQDIPDFLEFDQSKRLLPFDYGNFAFVYDTEKIAPEDAPKSLEDLTAPKYKNKVILIDPRTSSVGLGLLLWTIEVYGEENYLSWWEKMKDNALTIADGWSSAYGLFTEGEAPLVISYTTSPVYHVMWEDSTRYQTLLFDEGHSATIESVGILSSSSHKQEARQFVDFLLSNAQETVATTNTMYPANSSVELPDAFAWAPKPAKTLRLTDESIEKNLDRWLTDWTMTMSK